MTAPPAEPTRPRRLRRFLLRAGLLLALAGVAVWLAPLVVAKTGLRDWVVGRIFADLNGTIRVGDASLGWLSPVELRDVRISDPAGREALTADRVTSSRTLLALAWNRADLGTFTIERPVLTVACEPGTTNVEQAIANWLTDDGRPPSPERTGLAVTVTDGKILLQEAGRDGGQMVEAVNLTVTVPRPRSEPVSLTLSATTPTPAGVGTLSSEFAFRNGTQVKLKADRFVAGAVGPLVRRFAPGTTADGRLTADLTADWGTEADRTRLSVDGRAAVDGLGLAGPWLGPDRVRLQHAELPCRLALTGGVLRIDQADLTCDAGTASVAGSLNPDEPVERLLTRPGLRLDADLDAAKLAAILPRLLRVKDGTELREGRITVHLQSTAVPDGTSWAGTVRTTSLHGVRAGKPIVWEQPLTAKITGRIAPDGTPVTVEGEAQSDFFGLAARGSTDRFLLMANLNLDRLSARLSEFVDLGGVAFGGTGSVTVRSDPRPGGGFAASVTGRLENVAVTGPSRRGFREPALDLSGRADGCIGDGGAVRLDSGEVSLTVAGDGLTVALAGPMADTRSARLTARLTGDLARWWGRLSAVAGLPSGYEVGGSGTVATTVTVTAAGATADKLTAEVTNARFRGAGMILDEKTLTAESTGSWDRRTGIVALTDARLSCETVGAAAKRIELKPTAAGYGVTGTATVTANLNRVQRALALQSDLAGGDAFGGTARGTVSADSANGPVRFDADLTVEKFTYGPPTKPTWAEPALKLAVGGDYDAAADAVRFRSLKVERDGLSATAGGSIAHLGGTQDLDLTGTLAYDLAKLEPQLREYLGRGGQAVGKDSRPFKLTGQLAGGPATLAVKVAPSAGHDSLARLSGSAAVGWQSLQAYGFEVGPAELRAALDHGRVAMNPVEATFGGGKVRLSPTLDLVSKDYDLRFAPGRVIDQARLSPAACANALGYALPAIANAAQADGLVSFDLDDARVPLADVDRSAVKGRLTLHTATVSPGPVVTEVANLLGAKQTVLTLAKDQVVPVRLENGRVYHENFALTLGQSVVRTAGSVGLDGSLSLVLDLPLPPRLLDKLLPNNPRIREALAKQRVKVPIGGTLSRPVLDPRAVEAAVEGVVRAAARDAARSAADDLLRKGLGELEKKLGPPPEKK